MSKRRAWSWGIWAVAYNWATEATEATTTDDFYVAATESTITATESTTTARESTTTARESTADAATTGTDADRVNGNSEEYNHLPSEIFRTKIECNVILLNIVSMSNLVNNVCILQQLI